MAAKPLNKSQLEDAARLRAIFEDRKSNDPSLSQEKLAHLCGWKTQGTVNQYLNGKIPLNLSAIKKFSESLNFLIEEVSPTLAREISSFIKYNEAPAKLLSTQEDGSQFNVQPASIGLRRIPLISYVQAGLMCEVVDPYMTGDASEFLSTDLELNQYSFALQIKGDSMLPEFREGDRIIIDPSIQPQPGDFVVAKNGHEEATFKKYRPRGLNERGNDVFELIPLNEDYPTMRSDITPLTIIGVMVEHRKYRRR